MPLADFVHLRVHSAYSLSEGAIRIPSLVGLCLKNAMPAVAVTDSGNLFGALEFASAAVKGGLQPIIGCQMALAPHGPEETNGKRGAPDQLVLLVQNEVGYRNLLSLISQAYLGGEAGAAPQIELAALKGRSEGLIALTGGPSGPVGRLLAERKPEWAEGVLLNLARLFPGRTYVELQRHGLPEEEALETALVDLAFMHDLPLVATNDAFFASAEMYEAHDALLCIAQGSYVSQQERRRLTPEHRFKSAAEMRELFADLPEALDNTLVIARRCAFYPETVAPILPAFPTAERRSEIEELRAQAHAGLELRLESQVLTSERDEAARAMEAKRYR